MSCVRTRKNKYIKHAFMSKRFYRTMRRGRVKVNAICQTLRVTTYSVSTNMHMSYTYYTYKTSGSMQKNLESNIRNSLCCSW
jgi:hypothetical protein